MLDDAVVRKVLGTALATGGEWAEVYAEDRLSHNIRLEDRRVEELVTGRDRGAGVRVVKGTASAYAYTNRLDLDALVEAARVAAAALREPPAAEVADLRRREPGSATRWPSTRPAWSGPPWPSWSGGPTPPPAASTRRWPRSRPATATSASRS